MPIDTLARSDTSSQTTHDAEAQPAWTYPHTVVPGDLGQHTGDQPQLMVESTGRTFDPTSNAVSRLLEPNVFDGIHSALRSPAVQKLIAEPIERVVAAGCRPTWVITAADLTDDVNDHDDRQSASPMITSVTPAGMGLYRQIAPATPLFLFADDRDDDAADDAAGEVRLQFTVRAANAYASAVRSVERGLPDCFFGTLPDSEWQNTPAHVAYFGLTSALILLGRADEARTVSDAHLMLWPERLITEWLDYHARLQPIGLGTGGPA